MPYKPSTAEGAGPGPELSPGPKAVAATRPLRVLRISHSSIIPRWYRREENLRRMGVDLALVSALRWREGGGEVALPDPPPPGVIGVRTFGHHPCGFFYDPLGLYRAIRANDHEVLDAHEEPYGVAAFEIVVLQGLAGRRRPLVVYSAQNLDKRHPLPVRWAERLVLSRTRGAYPCNDGAAANLRRKGFNGIVRVLPLGVDMAEAQRDAGAAKSEEPSAPFRIGCAGTLTRQKGYHVLLEAVATEGTWQVVVAGDGPERQALQDQVVAQGMENRVTFLGFCPPDQMAGFYGSVDVLAVPSIDTPGLAEQFGRVVAEAMAGGVPVVSTLSGSLPEVIRDAGLLVPPDDAASLHRALAQLAQRPDRRREMAAKGRARARSFSWESIAAKQVALYSDVLPGAAVAPAPSGNAAPTPPLEVVVVAYGSPALLERALAGLAQDGQEAKLPVTVVDNSSNAEVERAARAHAATYLDAGANLGFGPAINKFLAGLAPGTDVLLLNPDAEVDAGTVLALQARLHDESRLACTAPSLVSPEGASQRVAWPFPSPARYWAEALGLGDLLPSNGFLAGAVLLLNGAAIQEVGPFDEDFFLYAEETDWQRRARACGWGVRLCPELEAVHVGGATGSSDPHQRELLFAAGQERYLRKWHGRAGWQLARAAVVAGALARAVFLSGDRRSADLRRAWHYAAGPVGLATSRRPPSPRLS